MIRPSIYPGKTDRSSMLSLRHDPAIFRCRFVG